MKILSAVLLLSLAPMSFAQVPTEIVDTVTVEGCKILDVNVDGKPLGELSVSFTINVPEKSGSGILKLVRPGGATSFFEMQCQSAQDSLEKYLLMGRFNEYIICDTIDPVVKDLTYGVPIFVDEHQSPVVETYTVFNDGQGHSGLTFDQCDRLGHTKKPRVFGN